MSETTSFIWATELTRSFTACVCSSHAPFSCEMAVARRPLPRMAVPALVIRLGCDRSLSIISAARSAGGGGFEGDEDEAIAQLKSSEAAR
jgi:hypothetical protein